MCKFCTLRHNDELRVFFGSPRIRAEDSLGPYWAIKGNAITIAEILDVLMSVVVMRVRSDHFGRYQPVSGMTRPPDHPAAPFPRPLH